MPNLITRGCWQSMSIWGYHIVLDFTIPRVFRTICKKGVYDGPLPQIYPNIFKRGTNRMFWTIRIYIYIFIICPDSLEFAITVRWRNWIGRTKLIHLYIYTRNVCISSWTSNLFDTNIAKLYITVYLPYYHFSIQRHGRVYFCWRQTNLSRIPITPCIYIDRLLHWYIDR
jgi:hypothetical protein